MEDSVMKINFWDKWRRNPGLWTALLVLVLVGGVNFIGWLFYLQVTEIVDMEQGRNLQALASAASQLINPEEMALLSSNPSDTSARQSITEATRKLLPLLHVQDIYIIGKNQVLLAQTSEDTGAVVVDPLLLVDQVEIEGAFAGATTSGLIFPSDATYHKRGYAPLRNSAGKIIAVIGLEASAGYVRTIQRIREALVWVGLFSLGLIFLTILLIHRVYSVFLKMEERLLVADKYQSLSQLSAGVAHEIKNPLGIISGNAELLKEETSPDSEAYYLAGNILEETDRMDGILKNFMDIARPSRMEMAPNSLNSLAEKTLELTRYQYEKAGLEVVKDFGEDLPPVLVDAGKLRQVILNLLLNAKEAMAGGGRLTVKTYLRDKEVILEMKDTGPGMDKETLRKAFEPFFTTRKTGSGLGLAIAQRIMKDHKGKLELESRPGKGTLARVILPVSVK